MAFLNGLEKYTQMYVITFYNENGSPLVYRSSPGPLVARSAAVGLVCVEIHRFGSQYLRRWVAMPLLSLQPGWL